MKQFPTAVVAFCLSASLLGLGCAGKPSKKIEPVIQQYDAVADVAAPPIKRGMDKVSSGDLKGAVPDLELGMKEMAKVSSISIEGCPEDFIMAWGVFASKHDAARKAVGQFVVNTKNTPDPENPFAGLAQMLIGGAASAQQFIQATDEMQDEATKLKVICSKYGVDGSALDLMSRIDALENPTP